MFSEIIFEIWPAYVHLEVLGLNNKIESIKSLEVSRNPIEGPFLIGEKKNQKSSLNPKIVNHFALNLWQTIYDFKLGSLVDMQLELL